MISCVCYQDGRLVCFSFSVDHPDASDPEATGHVRADLGLAGYLIEPLEDSKCKLTVVMRLDLGGSLMDWIREKAAKDQHENMGSLAAGLLGPNAARSLEAYVASGDGESAAIPNAPEPSQAAYVQLEALGTELRQGAANATVAVPFVSFQVAKIFYPESHYLVRVDADDCVKQGRLCLKTAHLQRWKRDLPIGRKRKTLRRQRRRLQSQLARS